VFIWLDDPMLKDTGFRASAGTTLQSRHPSYASHDQGPHALNLYLQLLCTPDAGPSAVPARRLSFYGRSSPLLASATVDPDIISRPRRPPVAAFCCRHNRILVLQQPRLLFFWVVVALASSCLGGPS
jgi:hypothetical protein